MNDSQFIKKSIIFQEICFAFTRPFYQGFLKNFLEEFDNVYYYYC